MDGHDEGMPSQPKLSPGVAIALVRAMLRDDYRAVLALLRGLEPADFAVAYDFATAVAEVLVSAVQHGGISDPEHAVRDKLARSLAQELRAGYRDWSAPLPVPPPLDLTAPLGADDLPPLGVSGEASWREVLGPSSTRLVRPSWDVEDEEANGDN